MSAATVVGDASSSAAADEAWSTWVSSPTDPTIRLTRTTESDHPATAFVLIDPSERHQTWTGVGAALTDSSAELLTPTAIELLFDADAPAGARLNLLRLPLSATDFSTDWWTWSWNRRRRVVEPPSQALSAIDVVHDITDVQPELEVIATPWTAPANMKTGKRLDGGALRRNRTTTYADMLAAQAAWLVEAGVPLRAVSLGNEPGHSSDYPSMTMSDEQMSAMANRIVDDLHALDVDLHALDHNWSDRSRADSLAASAPFDAVAFHCYGGSPDQMAGIELPVLVTECTGTTDTWASTFGWDARELVVEAARAGSTGLFMWNLALDPTHGPKAPGGCADCRGLLTIDPATGAAAPTPEFYTLAHVARAAEPGAVRVGSSTVDRIPTVAFVNPDGTIGVFGHNDTSVDQTVSFAIRGGEVHSLDVAAGEMFTMRGGLTDTDSTRLVPAGYALRDIAGGELTETEWVCGAAATGSGPGVGSFGLVAVGPSTRENCIVRAPEGDAHYVDDDGARSWIPDGATWFCEIDRGTPVIETTRDFVDLLDQGAWHSCDS